MSAVVVCYLLLAWAAGLGLTLLSRAPWDLEDRLATGVVLGLAAAALLTWLAAIPFGMTDLPVWLGAVGLGAITGGCLYRTDWRRRLYDEARSAWSRARAREPLPLLILFILAALFFLPFYSHALQIQPDGLHAGYSNIFGDWALHLGLAGYLSSAQHLLPPTNPWFAGTNLNYPFLPDLSVGIMRHLGMDLLEAMPLLSAILSLALVVIFYGTAKRLTGSRWGALAAALIFFAGSGLSFTLAFGDFQPGLGPWLDGLLGVITAPAGHQYTFAQASNYQWFNPILGAMVPQRNVLFGWPLGLVALSLLYQWWRTRSKRELALAGVLVGLIPLFQTHTYAALVLIAGALAAMSWRQWRDWLRFFIPALGLGVPQVLMLLPPAAYGTSLLHLQPGWMAASAGHNDNVVWFWFINTGLLIPLAVLPLALGNRWLPARARAFFLPCWLLFLIPNFIVFAPFDWDNTKLFMWWAIPASMLAGLAVTRLARFSALAAVACGLVMLTQVAAGSLDLDRAWQRDLNVPGLRMLDNDELAVASWARSQTTVDSVFLTNWERPQPILTLSSRAQVMGTTDQLLGTGLDYTSVQQDVISMFRGEPDTVDLLAKYGVKYVVIGPWELAEITANLPFYQSHFPVVFHTPDGTYNIFRVG